MDNCHYTPKRIGVIGGLGNEAMVDLVNKIATLPLAPECEYIVFGNSRMAYRPEEVGQHFSTDHPTELRRYDTALYTLQLMQHLGVNTVGLACNSAHELFRDLLPETSLNFVDMIHQTARTLEGSRDTILVMGVTSLVESGLYQNALAKQGVTSTRCSDENQRKTMEAIYSPSFGIKTAQITPEAEQLLCEVITKEHNKQGIHRVVLGCTELPLALTPESCARFKQNGMLPEDIEIIDASMVLAESLIAMKGERSSLKSFSEQSRGQHTDWCAPLTVKVSTLADVIETQERIFDHTRAFLAKRGQTITGSYSHLPTLFFSNSAHDVEDKLHRLSITVLDTGSLCNERIDRALSEHFDSGL